MKFTVTTLTHHAFKKYAQQQPPSYGYHQTVAGIIQVCSITQGVYQASFIHDPTRSRDLSVYDVTNMLLIGTEFQCNVWRATLAIPAGKTVTYQDLAQSIGHPMAWRAVARALSQNKLAYFIPCHRVVRKNGELGGYAWGIEKKKALLQAERFLS